MAVTGGAVLPKAVGSAVRGDDRNPLVRDLRHDRDGGGDRLQSGPRHARRRQRRLSRAVLRDPRSSASVRPTRIFARPDESGLVQVRGPQVFPGYLDPAHNDGTLGRRRLAHHRRRRLPDRGRAARADRPREGPDHPQRPQHRSRRRSRTWPTSFAGVQISAAVGMPDQYAGEVPALFVVPSARRADRPRSAAGHI